MSQRAEDLLSRMTLEEKLAQLGGVWSTCLADAQGFSREQAAEKLRHGIGHVSRIASTSGLRPAENAAFANRIQRYLVEETRLGIPAIVHEESTAGFMARDADQFPQAIGLAATWNPEAVEAMARVIRTQMRAVGARQTLAPVLDVARDPRWGRVEETYGEDPHLAGRLGVAYVRGIQGERLADGVAATGKHFLGYGLSEGGHNHKPVHLGPRELREVFAWPFACAIREAGLASVMNAYNEVDGLPCGGSREILEDLLRGELGFQGVVVADYFTTQLLRVSHRVAGDKAEAARMALEAGLDVELPTLDAYAELAPQVRSGELSEAMVDRSVRRILRLKLELGLFERPTVDEAIARAAYQTPATRALARELARQSLVLLRNEGGLLPLDPGIGRIALVGPCADDVRLLQGDYHYPAHTEILQGRREGAAPVLPRPDDASFAPGPWYPPTVTPLAGIREAVSHATQVRHARGCAIQGDDASGLEEAVETARAADVAVVCVGGKSGLLPDCTSGEFRDAADLGLTGLQQRLVEEVVATGTPTVVVLVNGRVLALPWIAAHVPALLEAWIPGEEGGRAIADVLFGKAAPSGRLPVTLPRHVGQVPLYHYRKWPATGPAGPFSPDYVDLPATPLFPFGHGLGYTTFAYEALDVTPEAVAPDEPVRITCRIRNTGERDGTEVVQLYVQDPVASVTRPIQQLAGFARVPLAPGETKRVTFVLHPSQLACYDRLLRLVVEPGLVRVRVATSAEDVGLEGGFRIEGEARELTPGDRVPTAVVVQLNRQPGPAEP